MSTCHCAGRSIGVCLERRRREHPVPRPSVVLTAMSPHPAPLDSSVATQYDGIRPLQGIIVRSRSCDPNEPARSYRSHRGEGTRSSRSSEIWFGSSGPQSFVLVQSGSSNLPAKIGFKADVTTEVLRCLAISRRRLVRDVVAPRVFVRIPGWLMDTQQLPSVIPPVLSVLTLASDAAYSIQPAPGGWGSQRTLAEVSARRQRAASTSRS